MISREHQPVMTEQVIEGLNIRADGTYADATLGGGGHAESIRQRLGSGGLLVGLDCDDTRLDRLRRRFSDAGPRCIILHANFAHIRDVLQAAGVDALDGALFDLGISSIQLDDPERGFTFLQEGPLDMRADRTTSLTAGQLVNTLPADELADLFFRLGDEKASRRIARAIVAERERQPIESTTHLAEVIARAKGGRRGRIHPATQCFMALRMAVNRELENLEAGLDGAASLLRRGGRLAVLTFHSVEDRAVKNWMRAHEGRMENLAAGGARWAGAPPRFARVHRKPIRPDEAECRRNPRARSAKCRIAERMD